MKVLSLRDLRLAVLAFFLRTVDGDDLSDCCGCDFSDWGRGLGGVEIKVAEVLTSATFEIALFSWNR